MKLYFMTGVLIILTTPVFAFEECFYKSAAKYHQNPRILMAIAQTESSMNPHAYNNNGTTSDIGLMQINSSWLPKLKRNFNLDASDLYNPCTNIEVGAWVLANNFVEHGYSWNAIGAYNAKNKVKADKYIRRVWKNLNRQVN